MNGWKKYQGIVRLAGMVIAVPLVAWFAGFSRTVELWHDCRGRQKRIELLRMVADGESLATAERAPAGEQVLNNGVLLDRLAGTMRDNRVAFMKYVPSLTREEGTLKVYTGELVLTGSFIPLLKVMEYAGRADNPGKIVSAGFRLEHDRNVREQRLVMTLVMQQLTVEEKGGT